MRKSEIQAYTGVAALPRENVAAVGATNGLFAPFRDIFSGGHSQVWTRVPYVSPSRMVTMISPGRLDYPSAPLKL